MSNNIKGLLLIVPFLLFFLFFIYLAIDYFGFYALSGFISGIVVSFLAICGLNILIKCD